jgi:hypothetical protein
VIMPTVGPGVTCTVVRLRPPGSPFWPGNFVSWFILIRLNAEFMKIPPVRDNKGFRQRVQTRVDNSPGAMNNSGERIRRRNGAAK